MNQSKLQKMPALDAVRALSMIGILCCHLSFQLPGFGFFGRYLGITFNSIFLALSALLLGLQWSRAGFPRYTIRNFFRSRISKIGKTYYVFLVFMFLSLYLRGSAFTIEDVAMHVSFLAWFDKLPDFGHLWFVTMISFAYVVFLLLSNMKEYLPVDKRNTSLLLVGGGFALTCVAQYVSYYGLHVPTAMIFPYLFLVAFVFLFSDRILDSVGRVRLSWFVPLYLTVNAGTCVALKYGMYESFPLFAIWAGIVCGFSQFALIYKIFERRTPGRLLAFLSFISFEMYLVHHSLCRFVRLDTGPTNSYGLNVIFVVVLCVALAYLLNRGVGFLKGVFGRVAVRLGGQ